MKKIAKGISLVLALVLMLSACTTATPQSETAALTAAQTAYLEHVDTEYSYDLARKLEDIRSKISLVAADEASVRQDYIRRASRLTEAESAASRRQSRRLKFPT